MCRNIKSLSNFDPPATHEEIKNASLQYVRKLSGMQKPARQNERVWNLAVDEIQLATKKLLDSLQSSSPLRTREEVQKRAQELSRKRFGPKNVARID